MLDLYVSKNDQSSDKTDGVDDQKGSTAAGGTREVRERSARPPQNPDLFELARLISYRANSRRRLRRSSSII